MTTKDLHINYRKDTGKDACGNLAFEFMNIDDNDVAEIQEYINWLEEKLIEAENIIINLTK